MPSRRPREAAIRDPRGPSFATDANVLIGQHGFPCTVSNGGGGLACFSRRAVRAGETILEAGNVITETQVIDGVLVDRSYLQGLVEQSFFFKLSKRSNLDLGVQYRQRRFTTDEQEDVARYERVDPRWRLAAVYSYELTKRWDIEARARYTDQDSDRNDPTANVDQLGYTESRVGVGVRYKF